MDNNYSLADIASVTRDGGLFSGGNGMWLFALILILMLGGGGFGYNGNNAYNTQYDNLSRQISDVANRQFTQANELTKGICQAEYTNAQLANQTQGLIASTSADLGKQISETAFASQKAVDSVKYDMALGFANTNANIDAKFAAMQAEGYKAQIAEQAARISQLEMQNMFCGIPRISNVAYGVYPYSTCGGCNGCGSNFA